jgi:hypothetical protein
MYSTFADNLGSNGMSTKHWGPPAWTFLFTSVLGAYPDKIDPARPDHLQTRKAFKQMLESLGYTMPCIYCRESYNEFLTELCLDKYLSGRIELMYFLYLMKDKVNRKLIQQQQLCFKTERKKLMDALLANQITPTQYLAEISNKKKTIFVTVPSPPFSEVLQKYEKSRASCDPMAKSCSILKKS